MTVSTYDKLFSEYIRRLLSATGKLVRIRCTVSVVLLHHAYLNAMFDIFHYSFICHCHVCWFYALFSCRIWIQKKIRTETNGRTRNITLYEFIWRVFRRTNEQQIILTESLEISMVKQTCHWICFCKYLRKRIRILHKRIRSEKKLRFRFHSSGWESLAKGKMILFYPLKLKTTTTKAKLSQLLSDLPFNAQFLIANSFVISAATVGVFDRRKQTI